MFLISITQDAKLHNIIFWLMGDLSTADIEQVGILAGMLFPCFVIIFWHSHAMNLLLMGKEMAQATGVNIKVVTITLLVTSSFMVSATVSYCGLIGFVGLVKSYASGRLPMCFLSGNWRKHTAASYWWMKAPTEDSHGSHSCREDIWSQISRRYLK